MQEQPVQCEKQTLIFSEALTIYQVDAAHKIISESLHNFKDVVGDLTETREVDGAGIQLLIALNLSLKSKGGGFSLRGVSSDVNAIFALFNLPADLYTAEAS